MNKLHTLLIKLRAVCKKKFSVLIVFRLFSYFRFSQTNLVENGVIENWSLGTLDDWVLQEDNVFQEFSDNTNITVNISCQLRDLDIDIDNHDIAVAQAESS